jgi:hypothetical protein
VLRALGVGSVVDRLGFQDDRLVFHNRSGRALAETAVGGVTMMRGGLSGGLRQAAQQLGVRFEFAKALAARREQHGEVVAQ